MYQPALASPWLATIEDIRSVDIRDYGLIDEPTILLFDLDDLTSLYEGVDSDGVAQ
jgi:hypothetical protein